MKINNNNSITIQGEIVSDFTYSHSVLGEGFYQFLIKVNRKSDNIDILPVMISDRLLDVSQDAIGATVRIYGDVRSYNNNEESERKVLTYVFAKEHENVDGDDFENIAYLTGYICKEPVYRETPKGREVCDLILAVNREVGKSDYIHCICWERTARYVAMQPVGTKLSISGRFQSREYRKQYQDGIAELKVAYELSVKSLEVLDNECED